MSKPIARKLVQMRLTPHEYARLLAEADRLSLPVAALARMLTVQALPSAVQR